MIVMSSKDEAAESPKHKKRNTSPRTAKPGYITIRQIAAERHVSLEAVRGWIMRGMLNATRVEGTKFWDITVEDYEAFKGKIRGYTKPKKE